MEPFDGSRLWVANAQNSALVMSAFAGTTSLALFERDNNKGNGGSNNRPLAKINLSPAVCISLADLLRKLLKSDVNTRLPFTTFNYVPEDRKYVTDTTYVFTKSDREVYGVEITNKQITTPVKIALRTNSSFTSGSDPMTEAQRSALGVRELIYCLEKLAPEAALLSRIGRERRRGGQTRSGGSQSSADPYKNNSSNGDDLLF